MNSREIQRLLRKNYDHNYVLENAYIFYWESDYFGISKSGYVYEIEVKISVSDFRADFKKDFKHRCLRFNKQQFVAHEAPEITERKKTGNKIEGRYGRMKDEYFNEPQGYCRLTYGKNVIPNRFYYAVPDGLAEKVVKLLPSYAGLLSVGRRDVVVIKDAPLLHREKMFEKLSKKLLDKFWWLSEKQRREIDGRQISLFM